MRLIFALCQPPTDAKTGQPLDTTKPAGDRNHLRLVIRPDGSRYEMNGMKYVGGA